MLVDGAGFGACVVVGAGPQPGTSLETLCTSKAPAAAGDGAAGLLPAALRVTGRAAALPSRTMGGELGAGVAEFSAWAG